MRNLILVILIEELDPAGFGGFCGQSRRGHPNWSFRNFWFRISFSKASTFVFSFEFSDSFISKRSFNSLFSDLVKSITVLVSRVFFVGFAIGKLDTFYGMQIECRFSEPTSTMSNLTVLINYEPLWLMIIYESLSAHKYPFLGMLFDSYFETQILKIFLYFSSVFYETSPVYFSVADWHPQAVQFLVH